MRALFFEGFDLYGNYGEFQQDIMSRREIWDGGYQSVSGLDFQERNHGNAMRVQTTVTENLSSYREIGIDSEFLKNKGIDHLIGGFAFMKEEPGGSPDSTPRLMTFLGESHYGSGSPQEDQTVYFSTTPNAGVDFDILCNAQSTATNMSFTIPNVAAGVWHYLKYDIEVHGNTRMRVWLNGSLQGDVTGMNAWSKDFYLFLIHAAKPLYHPGGIWYDDMYMADGSDAVVAPQIPSDLGPIQIRPMPLTSDGLTSGWIASSGGAKFQDVDEQPGPNDLDATYISTGTAPQTQMFGVTAHDADLPIVALTTFASVKQVDPTNGVAGLAFMADSQEDVNATLLQGAYRLLSHNYVTLPGGALSVPVIEATEFGVRSIEGT